MDMLQFVYGHDQIIAQFVASLIPHCRAGFGPNVMAIGVVEGQDLIAGIVYHNFDPGAGIIEMSGAALPGRSWLTRETLKRMYRYPFHVCGCQMTVMRVPADDVRLLRILAAYNYMLIRTPRMFGRDRDGVLCLLTVEDWEANKFNRRLKHHLIDGLIEEAA